jgi:hypothetical protein
MMWLSNLIFSSDPEKRIINMLGVTSNIRKRSNGSRRQHTTSCSCLPLIPFDVGLGLS